LARTVIFTGPSLPPAEAVNTLAGATVLPPIKRGDLASIRSLNPDAIAIIDGEFFQNLAVSPKEILPLLERGVRVYGASSVGALRAVEIAKFGMIGVGRVVRLFRMGVLDGDDEVALTYCPETYRHVSEPLVNIRYALRGAVRAGVLDNGDEQAIIARVKRAYFPDRTRPFVLSIAGEISGQAQSERLRPFLEAETYDVKLADARALLKRVASVVRDGKKTTTK
jgi:hypothetical protein